MSKPIFLRTRCKHTLPQIYSLKFMKYILFEKGIHAVKAFLFLSFSEMHVVRLNLEETENALIRNIRKRKNK